MAKISIVKGAPAIRTENALLSAYIFVDIRDRDIASYVAEARKTVAEQVRFPAGYYVTWSGQYEFKERADARLKILLSTPQVLNAAFDEGVRENVAAERQFFQEVEARAEQLEKQGASV